MRREEVVILRGLIRLNNVVSSSAYLSNYTRISGMDGRFSSEVVKVISFVRDYYTSTSGFPSFNEVVSFFNDKGDFNLVRNLEQLKQVDEPTKEEFTYNVKKFNKEHSFDILRASLEKGMDELQSKRSQVTLEEPLAENILSEINSSAFEIYNKPSELFFTSGDMRDYHSAFLRKVEAESLNSHREIIPSGVTGIDGVISGLSKGDLAFLCGFTGSFKTGSCVNWSLSAIKNGYNVLYITMENSAEQLVNQILSSHSANPLLFKHLMANPPSHTDIEKGNLTEDQLSLVKTAYNDYIFKQDSGEYGHLFVHQPETSDITLSYIRNTTDLYNLKCGGSLDMLIIDSPSLMVPEKFSSDQKASKNHIIRCLKLFALTFNKGAGLSILCPHQINREGHNRALQSKDFIYDHKCVADLNEIERSADLVMTIFSDNEDLRITNQILVQFLKTRNFGAPKYQNFPIYANMATRRWEDVNLDPSVNFEENFDFSITEDIVLG